MDLSLNVGVKKYFNHTKWLRFGVLGIKYVKDIISVNSAQGLSVVNILLNCFSEVENSIFFLGIKKNI